MHVRCSGGTMQRRWEQCLVKRVGFTNQRDSLLRAIDKNAQTSSVCFSRRRISVDATFWRGNIVRIHYTFPFSHFLSSPSFLFFFSIFVCFKIFQAICKINTATRRFVRIIRYFRKSGYMFLLYVGCKRCCYRIYLHEALFYETRVYFEYSDSVLLKLWGKQLEQIYEL